MRRVETGFLPLHAQVSELRQRRLVRGALVAEEASESAKASCPRWIAKKVNTRDSGGSVEVSATSFCYLSLAGRQLPGV